MAFHVLNRGGRTDKASGTYVRMEGGWIHHVNLPQPEAELQAVRRSVQRGRPFGEEQWSDRVVHRLGLETTIRFRGRPRNGS